MMLPVTFVLLLACISQFNLVLGHGNHEKKPKGDVYSWTRTVFARVDFFPINEFTFVYEDKQLARFYSADKKMFRMYPLRPSFSLYDFTTERPVLALKPFFTTNLCFLVQARLTYGDYMGTVQRYTNYRDDRDFPIRNLTTTRKLSTWRELRKLPRKIREFCKGRKIFKTATLDSEITNNNRVTEQYLLLGDRVQVSFPSSGLKKNDTNAPKKYNKGPFKFPAASEDFSEPDIEEFDDGHQWRRVVGDDDHDEATVDEFARTYDNDENVVQIISVDEDLLSQGIDQSTSLYDFSGEEMQLALKIKDRNLCIMVRNPVLETPESLLEILESNTDESPVRRDEVKEIFATGDEIDDLDYSALSDAIKKFCQYKIIVDAYDGDNDFSEDVSVREEIRTVLLPNRKLRVKVPKSSQNKADGKWWTTKVSDEENLVTMMYSKGNPDVFYFTSSDAKLEDFGLKPTRATYDFYQEQAKIAVKLGGVCLIIENNLSYNEVNSRITSLNTDIGVDLGTVNQARQLKINDLTLNEEERNILPPMIQRVCTGKDIYQTEPSCSLQSMETITVDAMSSYDCQEKCRRQEHCKLFTMTTDYECIHYVTGQLHGYELTPSRYQLKSCGLNFDYGKSTFLLLEGFVTVSYPRELLRFKSPNKHYYRRRNY